MPFKDIIKGLILLLSLSVITAFTVNFFSPKAIALFGEWDTSKGVINPRSRENVIVHEIEIEDVRIAKKIYDSREAVFVDAREHDGYTEGHIKGAISLPVHQFDEFIDQWISNYPTTTPIITYCSGRECDEAHLLTHAFLAVGYTNVRVFIDGFPAWESEGYPVEH
ncbi:MAG: rhodanese-like domain-containing protein [Deltaproteobacteria bacterium]|nr:rhodanese-like domain-containing protein [Deltaproteobacteria bacterium]